MKRRTSLVICFLSIIILCSLSSQPIIAEEFVNISVDNYTLNELKLYRN